MPADNQAVKDALSKKGAFGADLDLEHYDEGSGDTRTIDDLQSSEYKDYMEKVGIVADEINRSGTLMFIDNGMSHCHSNQQEGLELMSVKDAVKKYDWVKDYFWKAMDPAKDKYTAKTYLEDSDGYFIRVKSGYHIKDPVQTCMMIDTDKTVQNVHNLFCLLLNFRHGQRVGIFINPNRDTMLNTPRIIILELRIPRVALLCDPQDSKPHSIVIYGFPVNFSLIGRNVNAFNLHPLPPC